MIAVSIVSHAHGVMVPHLVQQLLACPEVTQVIVTLNVVEEFSAFPDDRVTIIRNKTSKGFGENHNAAFLQCTQPLWCVLNPDISLVGNPFVEMVSTIEDAKASLVAPAILSAEGAIEDSVRYFPTLFSIANKLFGNGDGRYKFDSSSASFYPEWVAGMFMLFRSSSFTALGGFDTDYFLYYEDVDLCVRMWRAGEVIVVCPQASAVHDARRASHTNWRHRRWHLASMLRYFCKHLGRLPTASVKAAQKQALL